MRTRRECDSNSPARNSLYYCDRGAGICLDNYAFEMVANQSMVNDWNQVR